MPLYAAGLALRNLRIERSQQLARILWYPVISIGNLSTGGSGKTPLTIALAKALKLRGFKVDVLSRGYGRQSNEPARVHPEGTAEEFGDEPLLIARQTGVPVYVAPQRYDAGLLAEAEASGQNNCDKSPGIRAHILDDGFQHRQLHRDIDILLLNRDDWRDSLLPAGNLREPLSALRRATVIAIPADDPEFAAELKSFGFAGSIWRIGRRMGVPKIAGPVAAFCGIARPDQFFAGLKPAGLSLVAQTAFADHHRYTARDIERLLSAARNAGARAFITTEKDQVRLGDLKAAFPAELPLLCVQLSIEIEDEAKALDWLKARIEQANPTPSL
jgi:tetraacyldisaccharide 4'-kinase